MAARRLSQQDTNPCGQVNDALMAAGMLLEQFSRSIMQHNSTNNDVSSSTSNSSSSTNSYNEKKKLNDLKRQLCELGVETAILQNKCKITRDTLKDFNWAAATVAGEGVDERRLNQEILEKCKQYKPTDSVLCKKINEVLELSLISGTQSVSQQVSQLVCC